MRPVPYTLCGFTVRARSASVSGRELVHPTGWSFLADLGTGESDLPAREPTPHMKVLFQSHYDIGRMYGGGPSVIANLAAELTNLGVEVTFHDYWKHNPKAFHLVHYFSCYG